MRAVTRFADDGTAGLDLNDIARGDGFLFVRDGVGLAGRGVAARAPADEAAALLRSIEHDDTTGSGDTAPVAIGWVPFDPAGCGELIVPAVTVRKTADGRRLVTTIDGADESLPAPHPPSPSAAAYAIEPVTPIEHYLAAVAATRDAVRDGRLTKAVIAREIAVTADRPIDRHGVLQRLKASFGSSYRYAVDGLIGASPELLVEVDGQTVRSHPLAGTAPRTGDVTLDAEIAARSSPAPRTRSSTASSSTSSTTRCCRGAASSTGSRTRRSSPSPTCSTSGRGSRACSRRRRRTCSSSCGRCRRRRRSAVIRATRRWR